MKLMVSPWRDGYRPYKIGQKIRFPYSNHWSFGCSSVYNWTTNQAYSTVVPNTEKPDTYFLRGGRKFCAGVVNEERDILVDGDWYYYISDLKRQDKKKKENGKDFSHVFYAWEFTIDSYPMDVPVLVNVEKERSERRYIGAMTIGNFSIEIGHADPNNKRWLSKSQVKQVETALSKVFSKTLDSPEL